MRKGAFTRRWFRPIPDYPDYWIDKRARVYSMKSGRFLATNLNSKWYVRIQVRANCKNVQLLLHRLVALVFVPNPDPMNKVEVNHLDWNKANPAAANLRWDTPQENRIHRRQKPWLSNKEREELKQECIF